MVRAVVTDAYGNIFAFENCIPVLGTTGWMFPLNAPDSAKKEWLAQTKVLDEKWYNSLAVENSDA